MGKLIQKASILVIIVLLGCNPVVPTKSLIVETQNPTEIHFVNAQRATPDAIPTVTLITPNDINGGIYITTNLNVGEVNVRSGPGTTFPIIGALKSGSNMRVLGQDNGNNWLLIEYPSSTQGKAWVYMGLVSLSGGIPPIISTDEIGNEISGAQINAQAGRPEAIEAIKNYLQRQKIDYQYLGEDINLNYPEQKVGRYRVDSTEFSVELEMNHIVVIDNQNNISYAGSTRQYSRQELEQMAEDVIANLAPDINLSSFTAQHSTKGESFFFRWVESSQSGYKFIQVGYSSTGNLLNYFNALGIE